VRDRRRDRPVSHRSHDRAEQRRRTQQHGAAAELAERHAVRLGQPAAHADADAYSDSGAAHRVGQSEQSPAANEVHETVTVPEDLAVGERIGVGEYLADGHDFAHGNPDVTIGVHNAVVLKKN
jgi:hypothetical protein